MRAIVVAGGSSSAGDNWRQWAAAADLIVGADGGAVRALAWGLPPHVVIGDMDSLTSQEKAELSTGGPEFIVHPRAKDETDLELALTYVAERGYRDVVVLGALGGRLDHMLANLFLLALPQLAGVRVRVVDGRQEAMLVRGGGAVELAGHPGDLVSLLPIGGDAHGVTTGGLAWPLHRDTLFFGSSRGVSNELAAPEARIEIEDGCLLVIHGPAQNPVNPV